MKGAWNEFQTADTTNWNRLSAISGIGNQETANIINGGQSYATGTTGALENSANAQASAVQTGANARANAYTQSGNAVSGVFNNAIPGALGFSYYNGAL